MTPRQTAGGGRHRLSSGVVALDRLLGGLIAGDNIVWVTEDRRLAALVERALLDEGRRAGARCCYVTASATPRSLQSLLGPDVAVVDARAQGRYPDPFRLEAALVQEAASGPMRVVLDGLEIFAHRWGPKAALGFFSRACPRMFDLGALAYWRAPRRELGAPFIEDVTKVTQCVLEANRGRIRVLKAEGRPPGVEGRLFRFTVDTDRLEIETELALGRLGEGLARLRQERGLSQADLARVAGVSPSAVSQAEAGRRGLSLDTLLVISQELEVSIDALLANERRSDYVLARRERTGARTPGAPLLGDPGAGLRVYLVQLAAGQTATPPAAHKGVELVLVAAGLVQVDLGSATPVMRPGDALLALRLPVSGWRNLTDEPVQLFWILRD